MPIFRVGQGLRVEVVVNLSGRIAKVLVTRAPAATLLVRLVVGAVFLSEGIQKFVFPATLGVGRFAKIGIPWPGLLAYMSQ